MAALQCYLREKEWRPESLTERAKPARNGASDFKIHLNEPWERMAETINQRNAGMLQT